MFCWYCYYIHNLMLGQKEAQSSFTLLTSQIVSYGGDSTVGVGCNVGHWLLHYKHLRQTIIQYCKKRTQSIKKINRNFICIALFRQQNATQKALLKEGRQTKPLKEECGEAKKEQIRGQLSRCVLLGGCWSVNQSDTVPHWARLLTALVPFSQLQANKLYKLLWNCFFIIIVLLQYENMLRLYRTFFVFKGQLG